MAWRFRRTLKILPGVRLNISKGGISTSIGVPGARFTLGGKTGPRATFGLPGTGISYTKTFKKQGSGGEGGQGSRAARERGSVSSAPPPLRPLAPRPPGLLEGLLMPETERHLDVGVYELWGNRPQEALSEFDALLARDPHNAEGHYLAGLAHRALGNLQPAIDHLENALDSDDPLPGPWITKHAAGLTYDLAITASYTAKLILDEVAAALTLAELYQTQGRLQEAIGAVEMVAEAMPDEALIKFSLGELYVSAGEDDNAIKLLAPVPSTDDTSLACRAYYAQALLHKGLFDAVLEVAGQELERTAGRDADLLRDLRYTRALAYEGKGQAALARREFQRLYAQDPTYRDVAARVTGDGGRIVSNTAI